MRPSISLAALALSLSAACGATGRCTADSQCAPGTFCDPHLGICALPGGAGGTVGAVDAGAPAPLPANYGRKCTAADSCSDVPGTSCNGSVWTCLGSCRNGAACPGGTFCEPSSYACLQGCTKDADCEAQSFCWVNAFGSNLTVCIPKLVAASRCTSNAMCASGFCDTTYPGGFCVQQCTHDATLCGGGAENGNVCVLNSSGYAYCFERCATPGAVSNCRAGFTCRGLQGVTYGYCAKL